MKLNRPCVWKENEQLQNISTDVKKITENFSARGKIVTHYKCIIMLQVLSLKNNYFLKLTVKNQKYTVYSCSSVDSIKHMNYNIAKITEIECNLNDKHLMLQRH